MSPESPSAKAASFLSSLRAGGKGGLGTPGNPASDEVVGPLRKRIDELERRLQELSRVAGPPEEGEPPRPPSELMLYIHTRMELLDRKLQEAQAEALRANLLLHEREQAQRQAQKEVEDLFRTIQEQQRAARFDSALRDEVRAAQRRIQDLEARLEEAQLRAVPAEQVLRAFRDVNAAEALRHEIEERLRRAAQAGEPAGAAAPLPPGPPPAHLTDITGGQGSASTLMLMAKLADLERELDQARRERDEERSRRALWERDVAGAVMDADQRFKRSGGMEATMEAALEAMARALKEREASETELDQAMAQAQAEPPGSPADPVLRVRITAAQERIARLQETLHGQLALVQAWVKAS